MRRPLVKEQEGFLEHRLEALNPNVDFDCLTTRARRVIRYIDDEGTIRENKVLVIFRRKNPYAAPVKGSRPLVKDQEGFTEHGLEDLNPDVDFDSLTTRARRVIRYIDDEGTIRENEVREIFRRKNPYAAPVKGSCPLVKDQEGFTEHGLEDLNPDVDFDSLTTGAHTVIRYIDDEGTIRENEVREIFRRKNPYAAPVKGSCPLVKDQEGFTEHGLEDLNPDVDFDSLTTRARRVIRYIDDEGTIQEDKVRKMFQRKNPYAASTKCPHPLVKDQTGFTEHKLLELNPHVDFDSLTTGSDTFIKFLDDKGKIQENKAHEMYRRKNPYAVSKKEPCSLVKDQAGFEKHRFAELNPDIDFDTLSTGSTKKVRYIDDADKERYRRVDHMNWKGNPYAPAYDSLRKKVPIENQVGEDSFFWSRCVETDPDIIERLKTASKDDLNMCFDLFCDKGHRFRTSVGRFYTKCFDEICPYCAGRKVLPGVTDAETVDPDLKLFYSDANPKPLSTISPYSGTSYLWECPYCGHAFTKVIKNMSGKTPKCPACKDLGGNQQHIRPYPDWTTYLSLSRGEGGSDDD